ncbi:MAG: hypothetical protein WA951_06640 [Leeuwenhoekiella sp.]
MKLWYILFIITPLFAQNQPQTAIYLFDITIENDSLSFENGRNISNNAGYNNQPSFYNNDTLVYARNLKNQNDIAVYDIVKDSTFYLNAMTQGSEYSPTRIPNTEDVAAVRLDIDGKQQLYRYSKKDSTRVLSTEKVGYFDFYSEERILAAVVNPSGMNLYFMNTQTKKDSLIITNVGRGIKKIPSSNYMSYSLIGETGDLDLYLMDVEEDLNSYFVCTLPIGIQDYTWLTKTKLILGSRNQLFIYDTLGEPKWIKVADLEIDNMQHITRLAVSPDGKKIAVVAQQAGI